MQKPDPRKRQDILRAAEKLFETRPYHEVVLDDVAKRARIGKGTIYIYFRSKEDLYASLVREAIADLIARVEDELKARQLDAHARLELVIRRIAETAISRPCIFHLARMVLPRQSEQQLLQVRQQLVSVIASVIEAGVAGGEFRDAHPSLTAQFVLGAVRSAVLFGVEKPTVEEVTAHLAGILQAGLACK